MTGPPDITRPGTPPDIIQAGTRAYTESSTYAKYAIASLRTTAREFLRAVAEGEAGRVTADTIVVHVLKYLGSVLDPILIREVGPDPPSELRRAFVLAVIAEAATAWVKSEVIDPHRHSGWASRLTHDERLVQSINLADEVATAARSHFEKEAKMAPLRRDVSALVGKARFRSRRRRFDG